MATFGVGDSAARTNTGPNVNMQAKQGTGGKVYEDGILVFNPAFNAIELIQPDTFDASQGNVAGAVVVSIVSTNTRAVYTVLKTAATQYTINWFAELVSSGKTIAGSVKVGAAAAEDAATVTLSTTSTELIAQYDFASDIGEDQAAFDAAGSISTVDEADGQTVNFVVAA